MKYDQQCASDVGFLNYDIFCLGKWNATRIVHCAYDLCYGNETFHMCVNKQQCVSVTCQEHCNDGDFFNYETYLCKKCSTNCLTCNLTSYCFTCDERNGYFLEVSSNGDRYCKTCNTTGGQYKFNTGSETICLNCSSGCL